MKQIVEMEQTKLWLNIKNKIKVKNDETKKNKARAEIEIWKIKLN